MCCWLVLNEETLSLPFLFFVYHQLSQALVSLFISLSFPFSPQYGHIHSLNCYPPRSQTTAFTVQQESPIQIKTKLCDVKKYVS